MTDSLKDGERKAFTEFSWEDVKDAMCRDEEFAPFLNYCKVSADTTGFGHLVVSDGESMKILLLVRQ
jgi:hypothetical protein